MKTVKKIIIALVIIALVTGAGAGGVYQLRKGNLKTVDVTSVSSLASDYYSSDYNYMYGTITTNVTQNITLDDDMIIEEIYVQKGDSVSNGDKLISFDMTLVEMELNIAKLKQERLEKNLTRAKNRLTKVQNGGAVQDSDAYSTSVDSEGIDSVSYDTDSDETASVSGGLGGSYLAAALNPILLTAAISSLSDVSDTTDTSEDGTLTADAQSSQDISGEDAFSSEGDWSGGDSGEDDDTETTTEDYGEIPGDAYQDPEANQFESGETKPEVTPTPTPTPYPTQDPDSGITVADDSSDDTDKSFTDGDEKFYQILDGDSVPYEGNGTEEEPYIFLVSSTQRAVTVRGSFFNKMAGYNADGTQVEHEGGYWYILEFHEGDAIGDYTDRTASCTGYYEVDGSLLTQPVDAFAETEFTLDEAMQYETEDPEEPTDDYTGDSTTSTVSRSEAIQALKTRISSLEISIRESEIEIAKLEKKVARQTIYSRLDGVVSSIGDTSGNTEDGSSYFLTVKSADGFFVKGTVSESMLDTFTSGTKLSCYNYWTGETFEAEVLEVSEYPSSDSDNSGNSTNPNSSTYVYTALIPDEDFTADPGDSCEVQVVDDTASSEGFMISKAFVKSENGTSYVYKDEDGVLKKQIVTGRNVESGYYFLITGGLTLEDKIAFAYGKNAVEGAVTTEVSVDTMYGWD